MNRKTSNPHFKKAFALLAALGLLCGNAVADEVAVLEVRFGKDKELQTVVIDLFEESAPATAENFRKLVRKGYYKGVEFHRAFPGKMVQTGDPLSRKKDRARVGTGGPGYTLPSEPGRKHVAGSVAMARLPEEINPARASNGSQFYIALEPMPELDGQYTVFGEVVAGLDVIDRISRQAKDSNDYPLERIFIRSSRMMPLAEAMQDVAAQQAEADDAAPGESPATADETSASNVDANPES